MRTPPCIRPYSGTLRPHPPRYASVLGRVLRATAATLGLVTFLGVPIPAAAEWDVDGLEELLPREETPREREAWRGREDELRSLRELRAADPPPLAPIRNCAEWEPVTGVLVRYPLGLPYNLLRDLDDHLTLHVIVESALQATAQSNLANNGVDMERVEFLVAGNNSIWTRDYGPWFVFDGEDTIAIVDHTYNRPHRPLDDLIPIAFAAQQGIPVHSHDMYHTGGNYMTDGAHISSSTRLVYDEALSENGMSAPEVDQLMSEYYGVETYSVMEYIESGGIHHIDTWAKFLDEETVLVKDVWPSHGTYHPLNQRATLLASLPASTGRSYAVHRVYCYNIGSNSPASYTNSLIANERVYVPLFGNATHDAAAIAAYEAAMPGYDIRGYAYGGWRSDDALHCRTKGVMDRGMLRVAHIPTREAQTGVVQVFAVAEAMSGSPITSAEVVYRQDDGTWITTAMTATGDDGYLAAIPSPPSGSAITDYYLHFADASGRTAGMPRSEPAGWYYFSQSPDPAGVPGPMDADPRETTLLANLPNPFPSSTTFRFNLEYADHADLAVFDAQGRLVRTLFRGEAAAGRNEIEWDGRDDHGREVASGVYYYRLRAAGLQYTRPALLTR